MKKVGVRDDDHAAGVLTGRPLDAGDAPDQPVDFGVFRVDAPLFEVLFDISERGLVRDGGDGAGFEDVVLTILSMVNM